MFIKIDENLNSRWVLKPSKFRNLNLLFKVKININIKYKF